jgi:hypothetical protein
MIKVNATWYVKTREEANEMVHSLVEEYRKGIIYDLTEVDEDTGGNDDD